MLFNSFEFIFIFLPIVLLLYFNLKSHRAKLYLLLISSYIFYGYWNYKFVALLILTTSIDYNIGRILFKTIDQTKRKRLLLASLVSNLTILGFFKYFNFFIDSFYSITNLISSDPSRMFFLEIVLPVGISFYTFQSLSYTMDIYFRKSEPHNDFIAYASYVALFPQLVAGPIVRHSDLVYQLEDPSRGTFNWNNFSQGIHLFVIGLSKKIILADRLALAVDPALLNLSSLSTVEAWLCALGYTAQLYFDFSGYSDMAVGLGKMMNFDFPQNFNSPYKSKSITEFWQRWHMTLSTWLRDYLYIPLGGNKLSPLKTYRNLMLTMVLGGLWHGANWVYVVWGTYHGVILAIERFFKNRKIKIIPNSLALPFTFILVMIGWVFFRAPNMGFAIEWLEKMFIPEYSWTFFNLTAKVRDRFAAALLIGYFIIFYCRNTFEIDFEKALKVRNAILIAILFVICILYFSKNSPFLYFQF